MWAILAGVFGGRVLRNGRTPDSVKQARWDARQSRKLRNQPQAEQMVGNRGFWPIVGVLAGLCVVGFLALALTR